MGWWLAWVRRGWFPAVVCAGAALLHACGDPASSSGAASSAGATPMAPDAAGAPAGGAVMVRLFQFQPSPLQVQSGTAVTWTNRDDTEHTVTAGTPENRTGRFDAPLRGKDTVFSVAFNEPGTYVYFCARHESMRGEIHVR